MWSRIELKDKAKLFLKQHYWKAFLVTLIMAIVGANGVSNTFEIKLNSNNNFNNTFSERLSSFEFPDEVFNYNDYFDYAGNMNLDTSISMFGFDLPIVLTLAHIIGLAIVAIVIGIFISNIIGVGGAKFFLDGTQDKVEVDNLIFGFKSPHYLNMVKVIFIKDLYIVLWTLLFIIPGIIKSFEYMMVPYILAENPELDSSTAIDMSRKMTDGHKLDIFVLGLTFIGWYILGTLLLGIGVLFVYPYTEATYAELYVKLKEIQTTNVEY